MVKLPCKCLYCISLPVDLSIQFRDLTVLSLSNFSIQTRFRQNTYPKTINWRKQNINNNLNNIYTIWNVNIFYFISTFDFEIESKWLKLSCLTIYNVLWRFVLLVFIHIYILSFINEYVCRTRLKLLHLHWSYLSTNIKRHIPM